MAAAAGRAIDLEDRRFRLLAHSAHDGPVDGVRRDTILRRGATPAVVERLERLGVPGAHGPIRLPADPALDMGARLCVPIRDAGRLLGFVWVLDEPRLGDEQAAALHDALGPVTRALRTNEDEEDLRRSSEQHALTALLADDDPVPAGALLSETAPVLVVVAALGAPLDLLRRAAGTGRSLIGEHDAHAVALLSATAPPTDSQVVLGVAAADTLALAPSAYSEARLALRVAWAVPHLGPVARFEALGPYGLLAPLAFGRTPPPSVPALDRLGAATDGVELLTTLRTVLDAGDDLTGAAASLHVHRSTLHRRLRRIEELGDVDLHDGATRLLLHAGLVLADLR